MDALLGHDRPVELIQRALRADRVHHAWIFSGPFGVGKYTAAIEFARILVDPEAGPDLAGRISAAPDGRASHLVDAGTHPDVHVIRKELALDSENPQLRSRKLANIPVDLLREHMIGGKTGDDRVHEPVAFQTPSTGRAKVFIIDEAELLDATGQNAILKTLEEPPPRTHIILVTARPERLLPTIRSRCQHVRFGNLDEAAMRTWLDASGIDADPAEAEWVLGFAEGSPGLAALAFEYDLAGWQSRLDPALRELEAGRFPAELGQVLAELVDGFAAAWVKKHPNASKDAANKDGARLLLLMLGGIARRALHEACERGLDDVPIVHLVNHLRGAEAQLAANVNLKMVLENLAAQWTIRWTERRAGTAV